MTEGCTAGSMHNAGCSPLLASAMKHARSASSLNRESAVAMRRVCSRGPKPIVSLQHTLCEHDIAVGHGEQDLAARSAAQASSDGLDLEVVRIDDDVVQRQALRE
eukprot:4866386-Prymnesium_polylepis.3